MMKKFLSYAIPSALAMFISSLYTVIDGIFVGQGVGDLALAAVNVVIPLTIMLFGMATMFAVGGGALISKNFGSGNIQNANVMFRQVFKFLLILSLFISIICFLFTGPIVKGLGATPDLYESAKIYLRFYSIFCIPNIIGIALNSFIRNDGNPKLAMIATISGAITNIVLDYLFIFPLQLGLFGAALATGLGQLVTVSILLIEAAFSVIIYLTNLALITTVGEAGITTYSIINYLTTPIYLLLLGLAFGAQPLISYHFGAKEQEPMMKYYRLTNITNYLINLVFIAICLFYGRPIISVFTQDPTIIDMAYIGLNIVNAAFIIVGVNLNTTIYYQAIEMTKYSNLLCACRSIIFLPIVLFILTTVVGLHGIWAALFISELLTMLSFLIFTKMKTITERAIQWA